MMLITHAIFGGAVGRILSLNMGLVFLGSILPDLDPLLGLPHRSITHSLIFAILVGLLFSIKKKEYGISIGVGILTHIFLDFMTVNGVPLFYPFGSNITLGLTKTANLTSNLVIVAISITMLVMSEVYQQRTITNKR